MLIQAFYAQQFSVHLVIWRKISPWTMPLKTVYGTFHFTMCKFQLDAAQVENELRIISLWNGILMEKWKFFMMTSKNRPTTHKIPAKMRYNETIRFAGNVQWLNTMTDTTQKKWFEFCISFCAKSSTDYWKTETAISSGVCLTDNQSSSWFPSEHFYVDLSRCGLNAWITLFR